MSLRRNFERKPDMKRKKNGGTCHLVFGVYHPKKPKKIRVVFDSSAQYNDNDLSKDIVDYHMRVHVFGNSPSPAVAIHGLHQSVQDPELNADPDVKSFVMCDTYVDDGLKSLPTVKAAVDLLKKTQDTLSKSNLRLHKIAANNKEVMDAFPPEDHANDLIDLNFEADTLPVQRSLGLNWNLRTDCFLFSASDEVKPFTWRGVLSIINSLYDPLGFVAPVTIQGKAILRELTAENGDWDAPLPPEMEEAWMLWRASLSELASLSIFRPYTIISPSTAVKKELHVFSDASIKAIATVAYLRLTDADGNNDVGTEMAAAALSRRGVAGVRTTKGLFFIVTLLSLVCVASSWMDKDQLEMHKEYLQRVQEELDSMKEKKATHSEFISDFISLLHPLTELMKKSSKVFSDIPLEGFLESIKIMEKNGRVLDRNDY
ncbi:hypothetical protein L3Q82_004089 [Scortum barcoo]|uniref:Uncharacterized protein n=1 Tax=Scortum barcoo TaxID=214431 RepID=A0ACB8X656_9TELE|nr:hypothetical protein L3Q82_004089 [Scortum barcoo]